MINDTIATGSPAERGLLIGIELKGKRHQWSVEDSLAELAQLARTVDIEVVGQTYQRLERVDPATYIGSGKVEELQMWQEELDYNVVVFDEELLPRHQRNLEEALGDVKVLDRTALILDIFAEHAHTREGALQVELAQYEYRLPRLTRRWTHLSRQGVGGVGLRGPGETQLESDRRQIKRRITRLKWELEQVHAHRLRYRQRRKRAALSVVGIVGYTNAGKSTLLNALSGSHVLVEDKLFATLDPTTRRVKLPGGEVSLFTDTVGFIQKLPPQLVAAFYATLEEINEADLLLHIIDITHPSALEQSGTVEDTLRELGAGDKPVVTALNKIDLLSDQRSIRKRVAGFPNSLAISAREGIGLGKLLVCIEAVLAQRLVSIKALIPYRAGRLVSLFHRRGVVEREEYNRKGTFLAGRVPGRLREAFRPYLV